MTTCLRRLILLGMALAPVGAVDYSEVQGILTSSCVECHGPSKAKGGLRLDGYDAVMKGGKHGAAVVPGFPTDSPLYARVILPADDPDVMPAKGDHLSDKQTAIILNWIQSGAATSGGGDMASDPMAASAPAPAAPATPAPASTPSSPASGAAAAASDPAKDPAKADPMAASAASDPVMHPVVPPSSGVPTKPGDAAKSAVAAAPSKLVLPDTDLDLLSQGVAAPSAKSLEGLKAISVWYRTLSKNGALIELDCRQMLPPVPAHLRSLSGLAANTVWLNCAGTAITDGDLASLHGFSHLSRLHLERTAIDDAGLSEVGKLSELTYLNLYGTKITDAGLTSLNSLTKLTELFLLGTAATPAGADALKKSIPGLTVIFDENLPAPAPAGEGKKKGKGKKAN